MAERISQLDTEVSGSRKTIAVPARLLNRQRVGISIDRTGWIDSTESITAGLEISRDGGQTWTVWCSVTGSGGARQAPDGSDATETYITLSAPPDGALLRAFTLSNGKTLTRAVRFREVT